MGRRGFGAAVLGVLAAVALAGCPKERPPVAAKAPSTSPSLDAGALAEAPPDAVEPKASHPDYPTLLGAGTKDIFFLEEPERGPWITEATAPEATGAWRWHAACDPERGDLECGPVVEGARPRQGWRVAEAGAGTTVAERWSGEVRLRRWIFATEPGGGLARTTALDAWGDVDRVFSFDPPGARASVRELSGANGLPGCGFVAYERDAAGRIATQTCLSWLGDPMKDTRGVVSERFTRREGDGLVVVQRRFDAQGRPTDAHDGVHRLTLERDAEGRVSTRRAFGRDWAPATDAETGCATRRFLWSEDGALTGERCLDTAGEPSKDRRGLFGLDYAYDARGCLVGETFLDAEGARVERRDFEVDPRCERLRERCFDAGGAPVGCGPGWPHDVRFERDEHGWLVAGAGFDGAGRPAAYPEWDSPRVTFERDAYGRELVTRCFDGEGKAAECGATGFHARRVRYDDAGREVEARFEGVDGAPTDNVGTWIARSRWDAYDHRYEIDYLDQDGQPTAGLGAASVRYLYDAGHQLYGMLLYDAAGEPARYRGCFTGRTCPKWPWHAVRVLRGANGRASDNRFFDAERQLLQTVKCAEKPCWR